MDPQVIAAIIVGALTVSGTLAAQYFGRRATQKTLEEQGKQLDRTLAEQRTRTLNERFATAAGQLGSNTSAICLAGVYAMAALADDWEETGRPASTCCARTCACPLTMLPYRSSAPLRPAAKSAMP